MPVSHNLSSLSLLIYFAFSSLQSHTGVPPGIVAYMLVMSLLVTLHVCVCVCVCVDMCIKHLYICVSVRVCLMSCTMDTSAQYHPKLYRLVFSLCWDTHIIIYTPPSSSLPSLSYSNTAQEPHLSYGSEMLQPILNALEEI